MEKKIEKKYVGVEKEFKARSWEDDNYDIDEVIEFFINAKKEGATHTQWRASCDDGCSYSCEVYTFCNETETDEDFEKRVNAEKDKKDKIHQLRTFFRVSNAAFDFTNAIRSALNGIVTPTKMHQLHKLALEEIEKESPDLSIIDKYIEQMDILAEANGQPKMSFRKAGI